MSAGSILGSLTNLLVIGAVWAIGGLVVVKMIQYANTLHLSADASNTIYMLSIAYGVGGILYFIAVILNAWIVSKNEASMGV